MNGKKGSKTSSPYKKRYSRKRSGKVATYQSFKKSRGGRFNISTIADPFPQIKFCKLVYSDTINLTAHSSTNQIGTTQNYRLNSIYDPWAGVGSYAPYGYNEVAMLYNNYKVLGVLIDLMFTNPSHDGQFVAMRITPPDIYSSISLLSAGRAGESPMSIVKFVNNSGDQKVRVKQFLPMSKGIGITPLQFKTAIDGGYSSQMGDSPLKVPLLEIGTGNTLNASATITCSVRLTYFTQCYNRNVLLTSTYS